VQYKPSRAEPYLTEAPKLSNDRGPPHPARRDRHARRRPRRQQDARRTFISLARADGARPDVLRWATHGPTGSVVDAYTTLPWDALCAAVACLKIQLKTGELVPMRLAAGTEARVLTCLHGESTTVAATDTTRQTKRARSSVASDPSGWRGVGDSNPWPPA